MVKLGDTEHIRRDIPVHENIHPFPSRFCPLCLIACIEGAAALDVVGVQRVTVDCGVDHFGGWVV